MNTEPTPPFSNINKPRNKYIRFGIGAQRLAAHCVLSLFQKTIRIASNVNLFTAGASLFFIQCLTCLLVMPYYGIFVANIGPVETYAIGWFYLPILGTAITILISIIKYIFNSIVEMMPKE